MARTILVFFTLILFVSGCSAVKDFGSSIKYNIQGGYYLQEEEFDKGRQNFAEAVRRDPYNPEAHYYYGRFLLAKGETAKALPLLDKAVGLNPQKSDYFFWLGVAYGELGEERKERDNYMEALRYDDKNVQALTYLGNNLLRAGKYREALHYYSNSLEIWAYNPQALYNRAVILRKLRRTPEEKLAWLHYLNAYPSGKFARIAADRLNILGDYSYRNHQLGIRTVTLLDIVFKPFSAKLSKATRPSLDLVGTSVSNMDKGILNIIAYQLNNLDLAQNRASSIRDYLYEEYPKLEAEKRIRISWFDVAEKRTVDNHKMVLNESVQFFLTDFQD